MTKSRRRVAAALAFLFCGGVAAAQKSTTPIAAGSPTAVGAQGVAIVLPDPPTPVRQAQEIGLGQCAPVLDKMARQVLTSAYDVQSGWSRIDPSRHVFQSVAVLNRPGNVPPDGIAALIAAPVTAGGCDGVALQVFPLAGDCQNAQKLILKGGKTIAPLLNARIMQDRNGTRLFLLPGYLHTCIAVSVDSRFGQQ